MIIVMIVTNTNTYINALIYCVEQLKLLAKSIFERHLI